MIDDGLILAISPIDEEPKKEIQGDKFWDASSGKMVEYIKAILPKHLKKLDGFDMFWYEDCLGRGRQVNQETGKFISKIQKHIDIFEYFKMLSDAKLEFA